MKFFAAAGVVPEIVQEAGTKTAALALVAARIGITIVPESLARRDQRGILFKRFTGNYPSLEIHVIYKKNEDSAALGNFLEVVGEVGEVE